MKLSNLLDKDLHITEKKKIWFLIPCGIIVLAAIMMLIFTFTLGSPLNLGMDFAGGYTMKVQLGTMLNDSNKADYENRITRIVESLTDEENRNYNLKVSAIQEQDSGDKASLYVKYKAVATEEEMTETVNPALREALQESIFRNIPTVSVSGGTITAKYNEPLVKALQDIVREAVSAQLAADNIHLDTFDYNADEKTITIATNATESVLTEKQDALRESLTYGNTYAGMVTEGDLVGATVSGELLTTAICAIILAIVLMLAYIAIRFELSSGLAAIVALFHDIVIMFCFMAIFHIEIGSTFIAALITILGYSINNTIIVFDRVREMTKLDKDRKLTGTQIANGAVSNTLLRSINTTLTTLITIGMVAIIGVSDIRIFALPIIAGLLAGTFSSICIAPSIWQMIRDRKRKPKQEKKPHTESKAAVAE